MQTETLNAFERQFVAHLRPLRGHLVVLDSDLAWFLEIEPKQITDAVVRRPELFPPDFVFHLTAVELRRFEKESPCLTLEGKDSLQPRVAFTTHGVGMLLAFQDDDFAMAAIPILRAVQKFWQAEEAVRHANPLVNRNS